MYSSPPGVLDCSPLPKTSRGSVPGGVWGWWELEEGALGGTPQDVWGGGCLDCLPPPQFSPPRGGPGVFLENRTRWELGGEELGGAGDPPQPRKEQKEPLRAAAGAPSPLFQDFPGMTVTAGANSQSGNWGGGLARTPPDSLEAVAALDSNSLGGPDGAPRPLFGTGGGVAAPSSRVWAAPSRPSRCIPGAVPAFQRERSGRRGRGAAPGAGMAGGARPRGRPGLTGGGRSGRNPRRRGR